MRQQNNLRVLSRNSRKDLSNSMANTLILRRRIQASQNVSKTTRAMQMIAASKLKKAQTQTLASKPYVEKLSMLTKQLAAKIPTEHVHPYMRTTSETGKTLLIIISPDKGLCGALVTNLIREYIKLDRENHIPIVIGKKAENYTVHLGKNLLASFPFGTSMPTFDMVYSLISLIDDHFLESKVDNVKILSTRFHSLFSQIATITTLLPLHIEKIEDNQTETTVFEPKPEDIVPTLLKHYIEMVLYQSLLENFLSEQAARMIAMQNATNNANDIISDLKLEYNKSRQAKITSEILDIAGGKAVVH